MISMRNTKHQIILTPSYLLWNSGHFLSIVEMVMVTSVVSGLRVSSSPSPGVGEGGGVLGLIVALPPGLMLVRGLCDDKPS